MKEPFDRFGDQLSGGERERLWEGIQGRIARGDQGEPGSVRVLWRRRWFWPVTAGSLAAAAALFFLLARPERVLVVERLPEAPLVRGPVDESGTHAAPERDNRITLSPEPVLIPGRDHASTQDSLGRSVGLAARARQESASPAAPGSREDQASVTSPVNASRSAAGAIAGTVRDSLGRPLAYAKVLILGTPVGAMTDSEGRFQISSLAPGVYPVLVSLVGYERTMSDSVTVAAADTALLAIELRSDSAAPLAEVEIVSSKDVIQKKRTDTSHSITSKALESRPVNGITEALGLKAGAIAKSGEIRFRGGRSGEVEFQVDAVPAPTPNIYGGTALPNDEPYDAMFFEHYGVNPFVAADEDPLSTFAVDVDRASYTITREYLGRGALPPKDAVRVEEFVNSFDQGYGAFQGDDFRILMDGAPSPFGAGHQLLRIGIQGRDMDDEERPPVDLVFVIDTSGSMGREDRLGAVKHALGYLVRRLREDDRVAIVEFGTDTRLVLGVTSGAEREIIERAIETLEAGGSTNAEAGLRQGYGIAAGMVRTGATCRVILCSDGVANVGLTGAESILAAIAKGVGRGVHLTTIGFGMGNYNDVLLEKLADQGDGQYYYVDGPDEARRVFAQEVSGTLFTLGRDAKVQVAFDSSRVERYRLLGFENRDLRDRDFRNDSVDAGEIGAGHVVTALYELKLKPHVLRGQVAEVRFRWAKPAEGGDEPRVREISRNFDVRDFAPRVEEASVYLRLDAVVAEFAEILRGSYWAKENSLSALVPWVSEANAELEESAAARELLDLIRTASRIREQDGPSPER